MDFKTHNSCQNDNGQPHSSGALMCSIRCSSACECLSLLTWCFSPFPPPLQCADTGLLSNARAGYGQTLNRADTHTHTDTHLESPGTLKAKDNVLSLYPSIMLCDPQKCEEKQSTPLS